MLLYYIMFLEEKQKQDFNSVPLVVLSYGDRGTAANNTRRRRFLFFKFDLAVIFCSNADWNKRRGIAWG